jgi:outer membrane beta-barrel protein
MRRLSTLSLGLIVLAGVLAAPAAQADNQGDNQGARKKNPLDGQPAVRHKLELRRLRFEVTPQVMVSMNQDFRHFLGGGLVLVFHINDWIGIGVQAAGGGGLDTGLTGALNSQLISERSGISPVKYQPSREQFNAHLASMNLVGSLYAMVTPFSGKLAIFGNGYARYDLSILLGVGMMNLTNTWGSYVANPDFGGTNNNIKLADNICTDAKNTNNDPNRCDPKNAGIKVSGMWGLGLHLFFNEWLGLNLEVRGFVASTNFGGLDINGDRALDGKDATITNNMFASAGLTFLLPIHARISP